MRLILIAIFLAGCGGNGGRVVGEGPVMYDQYLAEYCAKFPENRECGGTK